MIKGGYILQPRIIQESDINMAPPYVREIWAYLLREANSSDVKYNGYEVKRGQLFRSYAEIRDALKWYVGWRRCTYSEMQTKKAMKFLRDTLRIDTTKELGGVLITILKYDYYQNPKNYERTTKDTNEGTNEEPIENHPLPDNNKNDKNVKNEKNKDIVGKTEVLPSKTDFIDEVIKIFMHVYQKANSIPYLVVNRGKERTAVGKLLKEFKKLHPESNSEQTLGSLEVYFDRVVNINDAWLRANMSLPILMSKFNEVNNILRNGKSASNKRGTDSEVLSAISPHLSGK